MNVGLTRRLLFARIASMGFDHLQYGAEVQAILALDGNGDRPMPLARKTVAKAVEALSAWNARTLFPNASSPDAAMSGLYLYFCAYDESHKISQEIETAEGSFWHGILHRQEPDPGNAAYWFRRVGQHPIFPQLRDAAAESGLGAKDRWDPFAFIDFCEICKKSARFYRGKTAMAIQLSRVAAPFRLLREAGAVSVRAAVLREFEQPLEIRTYPDPQAGPGEAVVRVQMAGICGTDVHLWLGQLPIPKPVILGHETVGVIEQLGPGLEKDWRGETLRMGDRVCWASSISCGECFYCRMKGQPTRCLTRKAYGISYNADEAPHLRGGYAEKIHLRAGTALFRIPDSLPTEAVVGAGCALTTAIHGLERCPVQWGDVVVVLKISLFASTMGPAMKTSP